jgi:hypothetical protein
VPFNAFDGDLTTDWVYYKECTAAEIGLADYSWIKCDFGAGNEKKLEHVEVNWGSDASAMEYLKVEGSNDDINWTLLSEEEFTDCFGTTLKSYFYNDTAYRYYKFTVKGICTDLAVDVNPLERLWRYAMNFLVSPAYAQTDCDAILIAYTYGIAEINMYERDIRGELSEFFGLSGVTEGNEIAFATVSGASGFYSICKARKDDTYTAVGYNDNGLYAMNFDINMNTIWEKTYDIGTEGRSIEPTKDNGYIICGTYNDNGKNRLLLLKIDEDGDEEWHKYFTEHENFESVGRYAVQTEDKGFLAVGGSYPTSSSSKVYMIKTNKYGESCSPGIVCE